MSYITDNLILYFDGSNNTGIPEWHNNSSLLWKDLSGNNNDGIVSAASLWQDDHVSFNDDGWINCGQHNYSNITLEVLCRFDTIISTTEGNPVVGNWQSGGYGIQQREAKYTTNYNINGTWYHCLGNDVEINTIVHLTSTYDGNVIKLYENGVEINSLSITGNIQTPSGSTVFAIGTNPSGSSMSSTESELLNGDVFLVRLYDRALTSEEILTNYQDSQNRKIPKIFYSNASYQTTSGTTLTGTIQSKAGDWVLATVSGRSTMSYPEGWDLLKESTALSSDNLNQQMAFLSKQTISNETVSFTINQVNSERLYINLISISNINGFKYAAGNEYITNVELNEHLTSRPTTPAVLWGCVSNLWSTSTPYPEWDCKELINNPIALGTSTQGRLANFIDVNNTLSQRTFISGTATTGAIIDSVNIIMYPIKYLIRSTGQYYSIDNNKLTGIDIKDLNAEAFKTYGFNNLPSGIFNLELTDPELLYWQDSEEDLPVLKVKVKGTPPLPQTMITQPYEIPTSGIKYAEINATEDILFSISFDGGYSWLYYVADGKDWLQTNDNVIGMTAAEMMAIPQDMWYNVSGTAIQYQIRFSLPTIDSKVTSIIIHYLDS